MSARPTVCLLISRNRVGLVFSGENLGRRCNFISSVLSHRGLDKFSFFGAQCSVTEI